MHPADTDGAEPSCGDSAYTFDEDTRRCSLSLGCVTIDDCDADETCLDSWTTPAAASIRMGVRQGFRRSSMKAWFVTDGRRKHTIVNTSDDAFFQRFKDMRAVGTERTTSTSVHDTLVDWLENGPSPRTRLTQDRQ